MAALTMDKLVALCKNKGFIFAGSEIYGGLSNTWDYGPLGVEFKNNVKKAWWKKFVQESPYNTGVDCAILMNREVWVVSGHVGGFNDPLMDCKACKARFRADKLIEDFTEGKETGDGWSNKELEDYIQQHAIPCPVCGKSDFTGIRQFNLMFKTHQGVNEDSAAEIYLRPETAQGIFVNFQNVMRTTRKKLPAGIAQIGKSFRNEITPGNFIFRVREFEQMELEFFCVPGTDLEWFEYWRSFCRDWLLSLGIKEENLRLRDHEKDKLAFYSKATTDFEFLFPFGWGELCIEPSLGVDRMVLAFLCNAYDEQELENGEVRTVLHLHPALAPVKCAVLPLQKNKLGDKAKEVFSLLSKRFMCEYDETGSIGKRYRRQDEAGTPFCVTVDFDTLETNKVTVRDRDTMDQELVDINELAAWIEAKMEF